MVGGIHILGDVRGEASATPTSSSAPSHTAPTSTKPSVRAIRAPPRRRFVAYDVGEIGIEPGDLLCTARRPSYRNIAERRRQMGEGARTHCDVVVKVDEGNGEILAIGGNVRGTVSLKRLPAARGPGEDLRPTRTTFAHLKLRADPIALDALDNSPTMKALACDAGFEAPTQLAAMNLPVAHNLC